MVKKSHLLVEFYFQNTDIDFVKVHMTFYPQYSPSDGEFSKTIGVVKMWK